MTTIYVTKYATTKGILELKLERYTDSRAYVQVKGHPYELYKVGSDAFENEADAKANVRKRLEAKAKSLRKALVVIEGRLRDA